MLQQLLVQGRFIIESWRNLLLNFRGEWIGRQLLRLHFLHSMNAIYSLNYDRKVQQFKLKFTQMKDVYAD